MSKSAVSLTSSAEDAQAGCAPSSTLSTTERAVRRDTATPGCRPLDTIRLHPGGLAARVAERFVAALHRVPEAVLTRLGDERVSFWGVPGDAVEDGAHHPAGRNALVDQRRVERQLRHDQLVDRHRGDTPDESFGALVQVGRFGCLDR